MLNKVKKQKGFTLAELLIAIFILTTGVVGAYLVVQQSVQVASKASLRSTAAYLAQEGIEIIRNIRDTNFLVFEGGTWDSGLNINGNFQADYTITSMQNPLLLPCNNPCNYPSSNLIFLKKDNLGFYNYSAENNTVFKRRISLQRVGEILEVVVTVYWSDRRGIQSFSAQKNLYNWFGI